MGTKKQSKFEYLDFTSGYYAFAVNSQKYTQEEAVEIFVREMEADINDYRIETDFVRHRAGVNEDGERSVGWWLEHEEFKRSCPVWLFENKKDYNWRD